MSPSHIPRVVDRQKPGDVAAGFSSLPKADDFMAEYTLISVKENTHNCQTCFKKAFLTTMWLKREKTKKQFCLRAILSSHLQAEELLALLCSVRSFRVSYFHLLFFPSGITRFARKALPGLAQPRHVGEGGKKTWEGWERQGENCSGNSVYKCCTTPGQFPQLLRQTMT